MYIPIWVLVIVAIAVGILWNWGLTYKNNFIKFYRAWGLANYEFEHAARLWACDRSNCVETLCDQDKKDLARHLFGEWVYDERWTSWSSGNFYDKCIPLVKEAIYQHYKQYDYSDLEYKYSGRND
ncbi:TPA: hypothetical protein ACF3IQ_000332 [Enterobacter hormaechei]|nr:hypothetical protein [Enterobacter hormaechei]